MCKERLMKIFRMMPLLLLAVLVSCSAKHDQQSEDYSLNAIDQGREVADEELDLDDVDLLSEDEELSSLSEDNQMDMALSEDVSGTNTEIDLMIDEPSANTMAKTEVQMGDTKMYTVEENDTLMLVSFKLYGDYRMWKRIAALNSDKLAGGTALTKGMQLKYNPPVTEFVWSPKGNPYLIQNGDSLSKISNKVYGNWKWWNKIYDNNKPMIKDPNLIFAGFTLYYMKEDQFALN